MVNGRKGGGRHIDLHEDGTLAENVGQALNFLISRWIGDQVGIIRKDFRMARLEGFDGNAFSFVQFLAGINIKLPYCHSSTPFFQA